MVIISQEADPFQAAPHSSGDRLNVTTSPIKILRITTLLLSHCPPYQILQLSPQLKSRSCSAGNEYTRNAMHCIEYGRNLMHRGEYTRNVMQCNEYRRNVMYWHDCTMNVMHLKENWHNFILTTHLFKISSRVA